MSVDLDRQEVVAADSAGDAVIVSVRSDGALFFRVQSVTGKNSVAVTLNPTQARTLLEEVAELAREVCV